MEKYTGPEKTIESMPNVEDLGYEFAKNFIEIRKSGQDVQAEPKRLVQFVNSNMATKTRTAERWVKTYGEQNGYKLSGNDIKNKAKEIIDFFDPRKNKDLRTKLNEFLEQAVDESMSSKEDLNKMKETVVNFTKELRSAMTQVIDSHSIQTIDAGQGKSTGGNRAEVARKYSVLFERALKGTGVKITVTAAEVKTDVNDVERTAKVIESGGKREDILSQILKHKKPERLASK